VGIALTLMWPHSGHVTSTRKSAMTQITKDGFTFWETMVERAAGQRSGSVWSHSWRRARHPSAHAGHGNSSVTMRALPVLWCPLLSAQIDALLHQRLASPDAWWHYGSDQVPCTRCPWCQAAWFVRREYIIKGDMKVVRWHCGRCDYVWDVPEAPVPARSRRHRVRPDEFSSRTKPECTDRLLNVQHDPRWLLSFRRQSADISRMWFLVVGIG